MLMITLAIEDAQEDTDPVHWVKFARFAVCTIT